MTLTELQKHIAALDENRIEDADTYCLRWLLSMSKDYGDAGGYARVLLRSVARILEIYI